MGLLGLSLAKNLDEANGTIQRLTEDVSRQKLEIADLRSTFERVRAERDLARDEIAGWTRVNNTLRQERSDIAAERDAAVEQAKRDIASVREQVSVLATEVEARERVVGEIRSELERAQADLRIAAATLETARMSSDKRIAELAATLATTEGLRERAIAGEISEHQVNSDLRVALSDARSKLAAALAERDTLEAAQRTMRREHEEQLATVVTAAKSQERILRNELAGRPARTE